MNKTRVYPIAVLILLILAGTAIANPGVQTSPSGNTDSPETRAQRAMDRGDYLQAITILNSVIADHPTPESYMSLGLAYSHTRDYQKAEDTLKTASDLYPKDPRIPLQLANVYLDAGDVDDARGQLHRAIQIEPGSVAAADLLAAIEMSEGEVRTALHYWNATGFPIVNNILHNSNVTFGHWTVRDGNAFTIGKMMTYAQWRTTQRRLFETNLFSNVGISVEPAPAAGRYNPIILTTDRTTDRYSLAFGIIKGAPLRISYLDLWDIDDSGISINSLYRWDYNRLRAEAHLTAPLPLPGILFWKSAGIWRSERWNVAPQLRTDAGSEDKFQYNATGVRTEFKYIPDFRFEAGAGFEYTNRYGHGGLPQLLVNSSNTAKIIYEGSLRLADGQYQNRLHGEGYVARKGILGDLNYSAATLELNNRYTFSRDSQTTLEWTVKGGGSLGQLPAEDYFVLGVDTYSSNLLRAHPAANHGHYGNAPMGTSFGLANFNAERRITILPLFNSLNLPYLEVKGEFFLDSGMSWDREQIFKEGELFVDTGAGLKFGTPTDALNVIYGRSLRQGANVFILYIEKRW